ncbi:MAG: hypothetical protein IJM37_00395 [Lachnospiraceae bacterium]|nr:hypothetical protein [Lachnospiraceae bacterium]
MAGILEIAKENDTMRCNSDAEAIQVLYSELEKGIQSMKNEKLYTIEEAWEEIEKYSESE